MGVLQRFEHRLEGMVEGAFARAFKSELQPVEIASAVQREMDDRAAIVAQGRTLVPNDFVVELAGADYERLDVYADSLGIELATLAREHAREQGYSFVGPVRMRFEGVPDLTTGTFRIRSGVIRGTTVEDGEIRRPASDLPRPAGGFAGTPRLLVSGPGTGRGRQHAAHLRAQRAADHTGPRAPTATCAWSTRASPATTPSCESRTARSSSSISAPPTARSSTASRCGGCR